jgi:isochorismate hydrolase
MCHSNLLNRESVVFVVVDLQKKLLAAMHNKDNLLKNACKIVEFARIVDVPIVATEQYPKGLGPTVDEIKNLFDCFAPIEKLSFSAAASEDFIKRIGSYPQVALVGIETHVCICQTALNLVGSKNVHIVSDAVSSRTMENYRIGLKKCAQAGCIISSVETVMYEILKEAGTQDFKSVRHLLR